MGFEITYIFHEKIEDGYDTKNSKELKKQLGDPFDDIPLAKLAAAIMLQLARRDIWVIKVEITELTKKKINFKETKGGIILKNKKFTLDTIAGGLESSDTVEPVQPASPPPLPQQPTIHLHEQVQPQPTIHSHEQVQPQQPTIHPHEQVQPQQPTIHPHEQVRPQQPPPPPPPINMPKDAAGRQVLNPSRSIPAAGGGTITQMMVYSPDNELLRVAAPPGKFTMGKRYPVFGDERPDPREAMSGQLLPPVFETVDDTGKKLLMPTTYFTSQGRGLLGQQNMEVPDIRNASLGGGAGLRWDGLVSESATLAGVGRGSAEMPDLRGR